MSRIFRQTEPTISLLFRAQSLRDAGLEPNGSPRRLKAGEIRPLGRYFGDRRWYAAHNNAPFLYISSFVTLASFVMGLAILEHRHQGSRCSRLLLRSTVKSDADSDIYVETTLIRRGIALCM
jgi:hypothetical protein